MRFKTRTLLANIMKVFQTDSGERDEFVRHGQLTHVVCHESSTKWIVVHSIKTALSLPGILISLALRWLVCGVVCVCVVCERESEKRSGKAFKGVWGAEESNKKYIGFLRGFLFFVTILHSVWCFLHFSQVGLRHYVGDRSSPQRPGEAD